MFFPTLQDISALCKDHEILLLEVYYTEELEKSIDFKNDTHEDLEKFFRFLKNANQKNLFMETTEWSPTAYEIDLEEITPDTYGKVYSKIKKEAKKYNEQLHQHSTPQIVVFELYVLIDGCKYLFDIRQDWYTDLIEPEYALENICEQFQEDISDFEFEQQRNSALAEKEHLQKKKAELESIIASDEVFTNCTIK